MLASKDRASEPVTILSDNLIARPIEAARLLRT